MKPVIRTYMVYVCYPTGDIKAARFTLAHNATEWLIPQRRVSVDIYLYHYHQGYWYCIEEYQGMTDHIIYKSPGVRTYL